MEISQVKVNLVNNKDSRLKAFCTITIDKEFVVRDIKVIEGGGGYFVAMPSRKMTDHCEKCRSKNHLRARFCNDCGAKLQENRASKMGRGRIKLHADIAHPIIAECRKRIQEEVITAFREELEKPKAPGYTGEGSDEPEDRVPEIVS